MDSILYKTFQTTIKAIAEKPEIPFCANSLSQSVKRRESNTKNAVLES